LIQLKKVKTLIYCIFCGYWERPTKKDAGSLMEELKTDEEFGLTDIAHRLEIYPCPTYLIKEFIKDAENE
jgi:hypothetical protein